MIITRAAIGIAVALGVAAQPTRIPKIGVLSGDHPSDSPCVERLRHGLSLAHPGGNITGVTHFTPDLMAKRVQLLKEAVPKASRVALLRLPGRMQDLVVRDMEAAARQVGVYLQVIEIRGADDLSAAFDAAIRGRAEAVMSTQGPVFIHNNVRIAQLALKQRLPSLSDEPGAGRGRRALVLWA